MAGKLKMPQAAGIRRSVEFQHSKRGVGRMLRRGLHGSKNWVLEDDADGFPRSAGAKAMRAFIVLMPVWLVVSAATGGPERGGRSVGTGQAVLMALLITVTGLAWFSARERRLGHEEPWSTMPTLVAQSDDIEEGDGKESGESTSVDGPENEQVSDSETGETADNADHIPVEEGDSSQSVTQVLHEDLQKAVLENDETVAVAAPGAATRVLSEDLRQAITEGANHPVPPPPVQSPSSESSDRETEVLRTTTSDEVFDQFSEGVQAVHEPLQEADSTWGKLDVSGVTEGDDGSITDEPTTPLRTALREPLQEGGPAIESVQVSLVKEPLPQPLQGVLPVSYASPGPHSQGPDMLAEDWWSVKPDVEPQEAEEEPSGSEPDLGEAEVPTEPETAAEPVESPRPGRHPQVVITYLAAHSPKSSFTQEEKDDAREAVLVWLRRETDAGHLNKAEAARMLGVNASTVGRWLEEDADDPWADVTRPA